MNQEKNSPFSSPQTPAAPPCRMLVGPLMRPFLLGDWLKHPDVLPFYSPEAVRAYNGPVMEPEWYRFPPRSLAVDFARPTLESLWAQLPPGWQPELLIWWGFFTPLPEDLDDCPVPTLLIASDWQTCLESVLDYSRAFDYVLGDRALMRLLPEAAQNRFWPSYAWEPSYLPALPASRDLDVCFVGNLNPAQYRVRNGLLAGLARHLAPGPHKLYCAQRLYNRDYARVLWRSKIAFNHSLRAEMNMRAYEAAAAGALVLEAAGNLEIAAILPPGEACVLYTPDTLHELVDHYLGDEAARERIASRGQAIIRTHTFTRQFSDLLGLLPDLLAQPRAKRDSFKGPAGRRLRARHASRIFLPTALQAATRTLSDADDPVELNARAVCLAHAASLASPQDQPGLLSEAMCLLSRAIGDQAGNPDPLLLFNLAWVQAWRLELVEAANLLVTAMRSFSAAEFDPASLMPLGDFVLPLGFCSFALEWERAREGFTGAALWRQRHRLLIWNGLLLQSQLSVNLGQPADALPFLDAATDLRPELSDAWLARGQLQLRLGKTGNAVQSFETGLATGGIFPWVYQALITLYQAGGRSPDAASLLNEAESLFNGPGTESARIQLAQLRQTLALAEGSEGFG